MAIQALRVQIKVVENSDIKYPYLNADVIG